MRYSIRQGVFETNSSSTHATVFVDKYDYLSWIEDGTFLKIDKELDQYSSTEVYSPEFVDEDRAIELVIKNNEDLDYRMKGIEESDYPVRLKDMITEGRYRPFVEVGLIPYDSKDMNKDSGMIQFDDNEELAHRRVVELEFMI